MTSKKAIIIRKLYLELSIILFLSVVIISGCIGQEKSDKKLTEEGFKNLLTESDINKIMEPQATITSEFIDYKKMAESSNPNEIIHMNNFYGSSFKTEDGIKGLTFSMIEFDSISSAQQHFQKIINESELENMIPSIGDSSLEKEFNSKGIGSILVYRKGNKIMLLQTTMLDNEKPLTDLKGLKKLAEIVNERLYK